MDETLSERLAGDGYKRPNFPVEFKRRLVEQSFEPGASVALIARRNEVNANLLFKWRRKYLAGAYGPPLLSVQANQTPTDEAALLPVSIIGETAALVPSPPVRAAESAVENCCEVEFDRARLRIRGEVSPATLRLLIRELAR
ncbi:IS66-like element accessory protein TnpA [Paraburkholderia mimosarum]|uniref:IS66-like element accessory protein TnpA n=1 Tax=Paraburkholderia mimosarum TaxID=312026 RepID=UPI001FC8B7D1|nr:transposase [Paraburkholderia mimosarum]